MTAEPFDPDWTVAPAALVREWMEIHQLSILDLARMCGGEDAGRLISEVLDREPLTAEHARQLYQATGINQNFWLNFERAYREGLAARKKDLDE